MDRVKESLFGTLTPYIDGARCLDLFSGTGALSFEALSRGAAECVAVEAHPQSVALIKANQTTLGIGDEFKLVRADVFQFLKGNDLGEFDLVFADPPFTTVSSDSVLIALSQSQVFQSQTRICIESLRKEQLAHTYGALHLLDQRRFGDKHLSYYCQPVGG